MTDTVANFWLKIKPWPIEAPGYVFLARAVNDYGKHLYGTLWTGTEPIPKYNLLPEFTQENAPPLKSSDPWIIRRFNDLLARKSPNSSRWVSALRPAISPPPLTSEEWREALKLAREEDAPLAASLKRMQVVVAALRTELVAGNLLSFVRPKKGGPFSGPLHSWVWNTENLQNRFALCQMNPADPFSNGFAGDAYQYVYVDAAGLQRMLEPRPWLSILDLAATAAGVEVEDETMAQPISTPSADELDAGQVSLSPSPPPSCDGAASIGRPRKSDAAADSYFKLYPQGHGSATWKEVARAIKADTGNSVSVDTIQRGVSSRKSPAQKG